MQRGMRDAHVVEADHQIDVVDRRSRFTRHERGIAVEGDAGSLDRAFGLRRRHHGLDVAGERSLDRAAGAAQRGAAVGGIDLAEYHRHVRAVAGIEQVDRAVRPVGIAGFADDVQLRRETSGFRMQFHRRRVAHQQGPAQGAHPRVECGLERDFRADPGGVSGGNGDPRQAHGRLSRQARVPIMAGKNNKLSGKRRHDVA
jgi:hypothetical protein